MARLDIAQLLLTLQNLFYRISHQHLMTRINAYQGGGGGEIKEISDPLNKHLEALASNATERANKNKQDSVVPSATDGTDSPSRVDRKRRKIQFLRGPMNGLTKLFKRRGSSVVVQPHLSNQLQRSVRQHLNTSLRKARQGDLTNAKLYANLASNAIHELNRYMPHEEFMRFNSQICSDLKEFRDRDIYKPLTELVD